MGKNDTYELPEISTPVFKYAIALLIIILLYGFLGSIFIMGLSPIDAIYYTIISIATVGYGDIIPITPIQKIFSVSLILVSVGLIAYIFSLTITVVNMVVKDINIETKIKKRMKSLENHFILCGYGRVGEVVFNELNARGYNVIIIEKDKNILETDIWLDEDVLAIHGDATNEEILKLAGVKRAAGIIIATGEDVDNLFITIASRDMSEDIWIVSRASKSENIKRIEHSGADQVISPEYSAGKTIYFASIDPLTIKLTVSPNIEDIEKEISVIDEYGCTVERIEYYPPEFSKDISLTIDIPEEFKTKGFLNNLDDDEKLSKINAVYGNFNGVQVHWVSGQNKTVLDTLSNDLLKKELILGINQSKEDIKKLSMKEAQNRICKIEL